MADGKRMRAVRRSAVTLRLELNGTGHTHYYYCYYDSTDDLATLLARKTHRDVETRIMQHTVQAEMTKTMDTGIRVNHALARAYGVPTTASSSSEGDDGDGGAASATNRTGARLLVIGERLSPEVEDARGLALVDVSWDAA